VARATRSDLWSARNNRAAFWGVAQCLPVILRVILTGRKVTPVTAPGEDET